MEQKTARLTLLIDPNKKAAFEHLCMQQDLTPSQVVRKLIRDYLAQHGVSYQPAGAPAAPADAAAAGVAAPAAATPATVVPAPAAPARPRVGSASAPGTPRRPGRA